MVKVSEFQAQTGQGRRLQ